MIASSLVRRGDEGESNSARCLFGASYDGVFRPVERLGVPVLSNVVQLCWAV